MSTEPEPEEQLPPEFEDALGAAECGMVADVGSLVGSVGTTLEQAAKHASRAIPAFMRYAAGLGLVAWEFGARSVGVPVDEATSFDAGAAQDRRFRDPAWNDSPFFHAVLQSYRLTGKLLLDIVDAADLPPETRVKADFATRLIIDAIAPTNALITNPTALRRAYETNGASLVSGVGNFLRDVRDNDGWPSQVDRGAFELGKDLAPTAGNVIFRNELIEVMQYGAQTEEVYEIPLLICPPWINRYYIADLAPGRSLVEWAVQHGHTTFAISYHNPNESMRDLTFEDYVSLGPLAGIEAVRNITGSDTLNTLSICLGGTLTTAVLAYLDARGEQVVNSSTLLNSAVDYSKSGLLGSLFSDESMLKQFEKQVASKGYLDSRSMAHTFDLLRANDLVFQYAVSGWLLGEKPAPFDLLAWNAHGTNIPGKAHGFFVRKMYLENAMPKDELELLGERLKVSEIKTDTYIVAAVDDHIVPWRSSYNTTGLLKGHTRFVLTSAGHIAGIVNPPHPKSRLWTNDELPNDPDQWREGAVEHEDTWWNDWAEWQGSRAGAKRPAREIGNDSYPPLDAAPGTYVLT